MKQQEIIYVIMSGVTIFSVYYETVVVQIRLWWAAINLMGNTDIPLPLLFLWLFGLIFQLHSFCVVVKKDAKQSLALLHTSFRCLFLPFFLPCLSSDCFQHHYPLSPSLPPSFPLFHCLSLTPLLQPLVFTSMPPPLLHLHISLWMVTSAGLG